MNTLLDSVASYECYYFMDGYSNYNLVQIAPNDKHLTVFTTDWRIYADNKMPFGLCNARATFQ